jgi:hypothetical protein
MVKINSGLGTIMQKLAERNVAYYQTVLSDCMYLIALQQILIATQPRYSDFIYETNNTDNVRVKTS